MPFLDTAATAGRRRVLRIVDRIRMQICFSRRLLSFARMRDFPDRVFDLLSGRLFQLQPSLPPGVILGIEANGDMPEVMPDQLVFQAFQRVLHVTQVLAKNAGPIDKLSAARAAPPARASLFHLFCQEETVQTIAAGRAGAFYVKRFESFRRICRHLNLTQHTCFVCRHLDESTSQELQQAPELDGRSKAEDRQDREADL